MNSFSESDEEPRVVPLRLQKFLARAGVASRRGSENLMTAGRVSVNGRVVTELGSKVDPRVDTVEVDGVPIQLRDKPVTLILNKPVGYVTTMSDPQGRSCVADLMPVERFPGLYPVGRLDRDTTGILLLTTNGELGHGLLHPSHHVTKSYIAQVEGSISQAAVIALCEGVLLNDGLTSPAHAWTIDSIPDDIDSAQTSLDSNIAGTSFVGIELAEGRKRQIKRMCKAVGYPVVNLHRASFAGLTAEGLSAGEWREVTPEEASLLQRHLDVISASSEEEGGC